MTLIISVSIFAAVVITIGLVAGRFEGKLQQSKIKRPKADDGIPLPKGSTLTETDPATADLEQPAPGVSLRPTPHHS